MLKVTLSPYYETLLKDKFQQCNATYKNKTPKVILLTWRALFFTLKDLKYGEKVLKKVQFYGIIN